MNTAITRRPGRILRLIGLPLLVVLLVPASAAAQHFPSDEDLELMLRYLVEDGETPGIVLGVVERGGATRVVGYGSAGGGGRRVGRGSGFEIGGLTMTFTATLLAEMVMRGEVSLEDPVGQYLPADVTVPTAGGYEITLGDLATHRSGLPAGPDPQSDITIEELYELLSDAELERPGRRYEFSYLGYGVLGHALARAAGMRYADLLTQRVLEPLGMRRTGYALEGEPAEWSIRGHADGAVVPDAVATEAMWGATGLRSTAEDLLRFLKANVGPPDTELERAMRLAHEIRIDRGRPDEAVGYGFSWRTQSVAGQPPIITHAGATPGFTSMVAFDPETGIGTVLLANTRGFNDWIARQLLFFDPPSSNGEWRVDPAALRRYEGTYKVNPGMYRAAHDRGHYFIRLEEEGYLTYQARGVVRTRLYAESDSSFYMLRGPFTLTFSGQGENVRLVIHVDEREPDARARAWRAWKVDDEAPPPMVVAENARSWTAWRVRTWILLGLLGAVVLAAILRPLWAGIHRPGAPIALVAHANTPESRLKRRFKRIPKRGV